MPLRVTLKGIGKRDTMRTCSETTKADLAALGYFPHCPPTPAWAVAAYWDAMHERPMSRKREDRMRRELGLAPLPVVQEVAVCPVHGVVHDAGPCTDDRPVAAVVVLAPGERVVTPRGPWQSKAKPEVAAMVRGLEACLARKAAGPAPGVEV
jgi:hypothetical protein